MKKIFGNNDGKDLTFKYSIVNKKESKQINHHHSEHCCNLQNSRYLMIDDFVKEIKISEDNSVQASRIAQKNLDLKFKYCHPRDVSLKR